MQWEPCSNGTSARRWFVLRRRPNGDMEMLCDGRGRYRRFGSFEAANKVAQAENKAGEEFITRLESAAAAVAVRYLSGGFEDASEADKAALDALAVAYNAGS